MRKSKLQERAEALEGGWTRKERSYGPCFVLVRTRDGAKHNVCILAHDEPTEGEIRGTGDEAVRRCTTTYADGFHWILPDDERMEPGARGGSALAEAKRRILDDPADSQAKTFLLRLRGKSLTAAVAESAAIPPEAPRKTVASAWDLRRLDEPIPLQTSNKDVASGRLPAGQREESQNA